MIHSDSHDPILGDEWSHGCAECLAARNLTFAQLRHLVGDLGPYDTDGFIKGMQDAAQRNLDRFDIPLPVRIRPRVYDWAEMGDFDDIGAE
jgi:hypothetical protein